MWVTISQGVEALKPTLTSLFLNGFTHNLSHKLNGFNSPLTWGYEGFPQENTLVTTTTYNYMKAPVRFPLVNFFINYLKQKTCKVLLQREG
jgi:plastocyanin domain-containing protein